MKRLFPSDMHATENQPKGGTATVALRCVHEEVHLSQLAVQENFAEHGVYVKFSNDEAEQLEREALALALAESAREAGLKEDEGAAKRLLERTAAAEPLREARRKGGFMGMFKRAGKEQRRGSNSQQQQEGEYDAVLQSARALSAELAAALPEQRARKLAAAREAGSVAAGLRQGAPGAPAAALDAARAQAEAAEVRVDVVEEGLDELACLQRFLPATRPPQGQAAALAAEVVRQLLACLHHVGVPCATPQPPPARGDPRALAQWVEHFRANAHLQHPAPLPPPPPAAEQQQQSPPEQPSTPEKLTPPAVEEAPPCTPPQEHQLEEAAAPAAAADARPTQDADPAAEQPQQEAPAAAADARPQADAPPATDARPAAEQPEAVAGASPAAEQLKVVPDTRPAAEQPKVVPDARPAAEQPKHAGPAAEQAEVMAAASAPDEEKTAAPQEERRSFLSALFMQPRSAPVKAIEPVAKPLPESAIREAEDGSPPRSSASPPHTPDKELPAAAPQPPAPEPATCQAAETPQPPRSATPPPLPPRSSATPPGTPVKSPGRASLRARRQLSPAAKKSQQALRADPQVGDLFKELSDALPGGFMARDFAGECAAANGHHSDATQAVALTPQQLELASAEAAAHEGLIAQLGGEIAEFTPASMGAAAEFVRDSQARLGVVMADTEAVLARFETWPAAKWGALREAADAHGDLRDFARREKQWLLQRGSCSEEVRRIEAFLDTVRGRTAALAAARPAAEARLAAQGVPYDGGLFAPVRANSLHLATLAMSRALFEVASLERAEEVAHDTCVAHLAAAARLAHKAHAFAGGFDAERSELFDKVRRLTQYYLRVIDPASLARLD